MSIPIRAFDGTTIDPVPDTEDDMPVVAILLNDYALGALILDPDAARQLAMRLTLAAEET